MNLQFIKKVPMIEVYEIVNGIAPPIMTRFLIFALTSIISKTFRKSLQRIGKL